ncbi:MAG: Aminotransferase, partial [Bradyrhizobium sp.]|nr:Aminotransferase [Bradyrhizobium sp.]
MDISNLCITRDATLRDALDRLDRGGKKILFLVDGERKLQRTVSDGDLRRL